MNTTSTRLYDWIKQIPEALKQLDEIPLLASPSFPWESFSSQIQNLFRLSAFKLTPLDTKWRAENELLEGFSTDLYSVFVEVSPIPGVITWIQPKQDFTYLLSYLFGKETQDIELIDPDFQAGFNQFLKLEILNLFKATPLAAGLTPKLLNDQEIPKEACLCLDLSYTLDNSKTFFGRILLSQEFRKGWKEFFAQKSLSIPTTIAEKIDVTLHLEAGKTSLKSSEWQEIALGDLLLLDSCTLDLNDEKKRRILITMNGQDLFRAKIKDGNVKILEQSLYKEGETVMNKNPQGDEDSEFEDSEFEDSEFEGEEESEEFTDDSEFDDTEFTETEDGDHTEDEEPYDEELTEDEYTEEETSQESSLSPIKEGSKELQKAVAQPAKPEAVEAKKISTASKPVNLDEIPLNIVIEVGRIQMSLKKLLELEPGNLLELDIHPENGVDLVVNSKCIAKGELLKIGDVLGVRILEKG